MAEQYEAAIMSRLRTQGPEPDHTGLVVCHWTGYLSL